MKIPSDRISFEKEGYTTEKGEPLWLEVPRSVREGYVYDIIELNQKVTKLGTAAGAGEARKLVIAALALVSDWNFDDQKGKPLTVLAKCENDEQQAHVVAEIPMEVVNRIVDHATGGTPEDDKSAG